MPPNKSSRRSPTSPRLRPHQAKVSQADHPSEGEPNRRPTTTNPGEHPQRPPRPRNANDPGRIGSPRPGVPPRTRRGQQEEMGRPSTAASGRSPATPREVKKRHQTDQPPPGRLPASGFCGGDARAALQITVTKACPSEGRSGPPRRGHLPSLQEVPGPATLRRPSPGPLAVRGGPAEVQRGASPWTPTRSSCSTRSRAKSARP